MLTLNGYAMFGSFIIFVSIFVALVVFGKWVTSPVVSLSAEPEDIGSESGFDDTTGTEYKISPKSEDLRGSFNRGVEDAMLGTPVPIFEEAGVFQKDLQGEITRYWGKNRSIMEVINSGVFYLKKHWRTMLFILVYLVTDLDASKTLLGLAMVLTVLMELPFFFYSKDILARVGIKGSVIIAHIAFIIPWWVLPIEITHGIAFSCMWTASVTYFNQLAPPGRETTFQGILNGVWGVGAGIGSVICGAVYQRYGPIVTFRTCGFCIVASLVLYLISQFLRSPRKFWGEKDMGDYKGLLQLSDFSIDDKEDASMMVGIGHNGDETSELNEETVQK